MLTNNTTVTTLIPVAGLSRRSMLGLLVLAAAPLGRPGFAAVAPSDAAATIDRLNGALLGAMKAGEQTSFNRRYDMVAPAIEQAFDLPAVLAVSVGPTWAGLSQAQQIRLLEAFRRYTVASYVASFDSYAGQSFSVSPNVRDVGSDRVVVGSRITPTTGDATQLDYVMQQTAAGWKVVDVLAAGSISRVAVQRSDFRHVLATGGGDALVASLQRKVADLSGGALA